MSYISFHPIGYRWLRRPNCGNQLLPHLIDVTVPIPSPFALRVDFKNFAKALSPFGPAAGEMKGWYFLAFRKRTVPDGDHSVCAKDDVSHGVRCQGLVVSWQMVH